MATPKTQNWFANTDLMPVKTPTLRIHGEVETSASNVRPVLTEAVPQGINPEIFIVDLTLSDTGGIGTPAFAFRNADFEKTVPGPVYSDVHIRFEDLVVAKVKVSVTH